MKWGQDEAEHTNFRMQPGHSKAGYIPKHGALPSVLTADAPKPAPAVPSWCSPEVTPGPGAYELQTKEADSIEVQWSAFGVTGDGKAVRQDTCFVCYVLSAQCMGVTTVMIDLPGLFTAAWHLVLMMLKCHIRKGCQPLANLLFF